MFIPVKGPQLGVPKSHPSKEERELRFTHKLVKVELSRLSRGDPPPQKHLKQMEDGENRS